MRTNPLSFVNFLGGSPLNRLSWLRSSPGFVNAVLPSRTSRWIVFNQGQPLIASHPDTNRRSLALLPTADIQSLLGETPYFGQGQLPGSSAEPEGEGGKVPSVLEAARLRGLPVVFLGLLEPKHGAVASEQVAKEDVKASAEHGEPAPAQRSALPTSDFTDPERAIAQLADCTPYFTLDVADAEPGVLDEVLKNSALAKEGHALSFIEPRGAMSSLDPFTAGVFAEARSMMDWNTRNRFCPGCGSAVHSLWAGWKLSCTSLLPWADNTGKKPCPSGKGLHNFAHPRTDPVVIMLAVDETGEKILMGRNKKFPGKFYSALAGFIEPGEAFEDAVKREMWEEAGVRVWNVRYHSGQPWPYPANLMVGFYATADSAAPIRTDLDNELEDARWFTREEVRAVLAHPSGTNFTRRDYKQIADEVDPPVKDQQQSKEAASAHAIAPKDEEPPFRMPPMTAIAGVLIKHWADGGSVDGGRVSGYSTKGNL
ncbi:hypothetical protein CONPUDRAFT_81396 [Coniophora puteana RWD-64-598 SS2]|uniref:NAD(+) diphosphatase n=1 Tax=Coniophora puteana (strain RWD-64-598) TaxID=741705 RepID=A0A5M3MXL6_CONPW|nr:uncharacterized protein CONPUDRAFT_81396 [Coniophora puteana RWD-64-598 SS2]EIW83465.1 hypothetical protein CONPUDRAFT_81396 [Coniophora puteana RWD-64-598 SS2]